jgi:peptidyl-prolyl cis-trans isomerase D
MLQKMHDHMKGIVTVVLFGLLAVVFIFWGVNRDVISAQTYAAKVNGEKISIEVVRRAYQDQVVQFERKLQGELPAALKEQLRSNVVESYVRQTLLLERTTGLHYRVSPDDVNRIYESRPEFQIDGKFDAEYALRRLRVANETPASWEKSTREAMQVTQLQNGVIDSQFLTPGEQARAAALNFEERQVSYAVVPAARYLASIAPTDAQVKSYYDAHKGEFLTAETVALEYVELKRDELAAQEAVSEEILRKFYSDNIDRYRQKERRRARHILVSVTRPEDDAAARKKANELYQKLKGGADFAALAKQSSDDVTTQTTGGDLEWREAGAFEAPVDDAIFSMQLNEVHAPVKSKFGYHILRLDGIEPAKQKSFEDVRAQLEPEYRSGAADRDFGDRQEKLADLAFSESGDLGALARELKLEIKKIAEFSRNAGGGALGPNKAVITAAFSDDVLNGSNSEPVQLAPGDVIVLRASGHKAAEPRPLGDVSGEIIKRLKSEGARAQAKAAGDALLTSLNGGAVWDQALALANVVPTPYQYVPRSDTKLPAGVHDALFAAPRPQAGQVVYRGVPVNDGDYAVLAFSGVRDNSSGESVEQRSGRARELEARLGVGDIAAYTAELERSADIERNDKALE